VIQERFPSAKKTQTAFAIWMLTNRGTETTLDQLKEEAEVRGIKGVNFAHLGHAKRMISGTPRKPRRKQKTGRRKPGRPKGASSVKTRAMSADELLQSMEKSYRNRADKIAEIRKGLSEEVENLKL
jgi:hypothetical protein